MKKLASYGFLFLVVVVVNQHAFTAKKDAQGAFEHVNLSDVDVAYGALMSSSGALYSEIYARVAPHMAELKKEREEEEKKKAALISVAPGVAHSAAKIAASSPVDKKRTVRVSLINRSVDVEVPLNTTVADLVERLKLNGVDVPAGACLYRSGTVGNFCLKENPIYSNVYPINISDLTHSESLNPRQVLPECTSHGFSVLTDGQCRAVLNRFAVDAADNGWYSSHTNLYRNVEALFQRYDTRLRHDFNALPSLVVTALGKGRVCQNVQDEAARASKEITDATAEFDEILAWAEKTSLDKIDKDKEKELCGELKEKLQKQEARLRKAKMDKERLDKEAAEGLRLLK